MIEKEFIEKVKKQSGYVGVLDVYRLIHFYTEKWDVLTTKLTVEDELVYMWLKLQQDRPTKKNCYSCNKEKDLEEYHIDNNKFDKKCLYCKSCITEKSKIKRYGITN